jgi:anti-anti-sigma factor
MLEKAVLAGAGASVVQLAGCEYASSDGARLGRLRRLLVRLASEPGPEPLVLDLSLVHFFGAGFIGVLVDTWAQLRAQDRQLVLRGLTPFCARLIRALHLHKLFAIDNDVPTAVEESESILVRIRKSNVAWDADMVRLEYVGDDGTPIRCVIVPRTAIQDR